MFTNSNIKSGLAKLKTRHCAYLYYKRHIKHISFIIYIKYSHNTIEIFIEIVYNRTKQT